MKFKSTGIKNTSLPQNSVHIKLFVSSYEWFYLPFAEAGKNHLSWLDLTFCDSIVPVYLLRGTNYPENLEPKAFQIMGFCITYFWKLLLCQVKTITVFVHRGQVIFSIVLTKPAS
jgi:hypothetical protein